MKRTALFIVPAIALALLVVRAYAADQAKIGQPAPNFSLQDQDGKTVNLADLKGKIVVLEWFNPGCPYVQRHYKSDINTMNKLYDKWSAKDVQWLAINTTRGNTPGSNKQAADKWNIKHSVLSDADSSVAKAYGAKTTPHMFIIDKQGVLVYAGGIDNDRDGDKSSDKVNYVDKALSELTAGQTVSEPETESYGCGVKYSK
jgi:peroxiredoxin